MLTLIVFIVVGIPSILFRGWALYVLWGWFMLPLGIPAIGIAHALGLSTLIGLFTASTAELKAGLAADEGKSSAERASENAVAAVIIPLLALAFGWIFKIFMG